VLNIDKCPYFFYVGYEQFETTINNIVYTESKGILSSVNIFKENSGFYCFIIHPFAVYYSFSSCQS